MKKKEWRFDRWNFASCPSLLAGAKGTALF